MCALGNTHVGIQAVFNHNTTYRIAFASQKIQSKFKDTLHESCPHVTSTQASCLDLAPKQKRGRLKKKEREESDRKHVTKKQAGMKKYLQK